MAYERKAVYGIEEVLSKRLPSELKKSSLTEVDFDGDKMYMTSQRYEVFDVKGIKCCTCGLEGQYFAKEKDCNARRYHFNLYGTDAEGNEVMMTKDHIIPKSKGGTDTLENYQTMCKPCNMAKGSQVRTSPVKKTV